MVDLAELLPLVPPAFLPEDVEPHAAGPVTVAARISGPLGSQDTPPDVSWSASFANASSPEFEGGVA